MGFHPIRKIRKLVDRSSLTRRSRERFLSQKTFRVGELELPYVIHPHNFTWTNERAVEISLARHWLETHAGQKTLEVGNVTRHYFGGQHVVVDKYEQAEGVINIDVVDFSPETGFQNIFAISTLEHVGWDRDQKEPDKIRIAVDKLKQLLLPGGELMVTVPVGFNHFLDDFIGNDTLRFDEYRFLKRISGLNEWTETTWADVCHTEYNQPYPNANAIVMALYRRP